ncbi:glycodelin-like isoform X2 [Saimiri boliviensis]|uniref:glycodelin-like isoform X2 n=1 Tax=Saimiri boliviensis TaxID=27679 RepID=UPI003D773AB4
MGLSGPLPAPQAIPLPWTQLFSLLASDPTLSRSPDPEGAPTTGCPPGPDPGPSHLRPCQELPGWTQRRFLRGHREEPPMVQWRKLPVGDAPLRIYITSLMPTTEGNLEIILHRWENNSCVEKKVLAEKTENPKNFRINCADMAVNEATLLETDYDKFLFLCLKSTAAPRQSTMCQYLARSLEADAEVLKAFFRAFKTLPVQIWFLLEWYQVPEPCPI